MHIFIPVNKKNITEPDLKLNGNEIENEQNIIECNRNWYICHADCEDIPVCTNQTSEKFKREQKRAKTE